MPDLMMREGVHPETPPPPFTPGWDLIGVVDRLGDGISVLLPDAGLWPNFLATRGPIGFRSFIPISGLYIAGGWLLPGRKRVVPYSIQWLKPLGPALLRQDLIALFDLLQRKKIKPLIAQRFPLSEARQAHELLGEGGVRSKIVLVRQRIVA